jgi:hypothetical protein
MLPTSNCETRLDKRIGDDALIDIEDDEKSVSRDCSFFEKIFHAATCAPRTEDVCEDNKK